MASRNEPAIPSWIIVAAAALLILAVVAVGFASSLNDFLLSLGVPSDYVGPFGAVIAWGVFIGLIVLIIRTLGRSSRL